MGIQAWRCAVVLTLVGACIAVTLYHHHQQPSFALLQVGALFVCELCCPEVRTFRVNCGFTFGRM